MLKAANELMPQFATHLSAGNDPGSLDTNRSFIYQNAGGIGVDGKGFLFTATRDDTPKWADRRSKHDVTPKFILASHGQPYFKGQIPVPARSMSLI